MSLNTNSNTRRSSTFSDDTTPLISSKIYLGFKKTLFQSPYWTNHLIIGLNNFPETKVFFINSICTIQITPIKNNYPNSIIIFSHGTGVNIYTMYNYLRILANDIGIIVVSYDYPGYGISQGEPSEENCLKSLSLVVDYYNNYKELLIGQSLGTGVVVDYVSTNDWTLPIILISPFLSISSILGLGINSNIIKNNFNSFSKVEKIQCPVYIIHGEKDELVPISEGKNLYEKIKNKAGSIWMEGVGHLGIFIPIEYLKNILDQF